MQNSLKDRTILVTGASGGIGAACARAFAAAGAELILVARRESELKALSAELQALGARAEYFCCDLGEPAQVLDLCEKLKVKPRLDGILHNAGVGLYGEFATLDPAETRRLMEVNFFSILSLTQALLPQLRRSSRPQIALVSSVVGWRGIPRLNVYCASKAALNLWAESLRVELKKSGIALLNVYPGTTSTNFNQAAMSSGWRPTEREARGVSAEYVARKILRAYLKRKRQEYVTLSNRAVIHVSFFFPKLVDWALERYFAKR